MRPRSSRNHSKPHFWIAGLVIALGVTLSLSATLQKSVTVDEFQALPSGLAMLRTGDFRYPLGTPPLSQLLPAMPLLVTPALVKPIEGPTANWAVAHQFASDNSDRFHFYFLLGRLVSAFVLLCTLFLAWRLSMELYGPLGAWITVACLSLNPSFLAHGCLVTPDIYLACAVMAFLLAFERFRKNLGLIEAFAVGATVGTACLMKFTAIFLFPLIPALAMIALPKQQWKKAIVQIGPGLAVALLVIHVGYAFQGILPSVGSLSAEKNLHHILITFLPQWMPLPLPAQFLRALNQQLSEPPYVAYLLGELNLEGFFSYYLVAFLVKTPVPLLLLPFAACLPAWRPARRELPLLTLGAFFFLFFSIARFKNLGLRYLLFLYPVAAVWTARLAQMLEKGPRKARASFAGAIALAGAGTLLSWPHYLAYFNLPSGGFAEGHHYLLDSNLDWGQDLSTLQNFLGTRGIESVDLAHFGHVDPSLYGIRYRTLNGAPAGRWVAISANFLWGRSYFVNGSLLYPEHTRVYEPYRALEPEAVLGHTIYVYDMEKIRANLR